MELLTVAETAKLLRLSKSQVYVLLKRRRLPYIKLGEKRIVIRRMELERFLEANTIQISVNWPKLDGPNVKLDERALTVY